MADMRRYLALSGESPTEDLLRSFDGIGLVRSEYLFRHAERYPTAASAGPVVLEYLRSLPPAAARGPVWYRTLEVTTAEANVLAGVEQEYPESNNELMGLRGVRRSMAHPESLNHELEAVAAAREVLPYLGVVCPFVSDPAELTWFAERVLAVAGDLPVATMIETPAAMLQCRELVTVGGIDHVIVGCNDLRAFLDARTRPMNVATPLSPALASALAMIRSATAETDTTMTVAGYLTLEIMGFCEKVGVDGIVVHYTDLPALLGPSYEHLDDLGRVRFIKELTRARIRKHSGT